MSDSITIGCTASAPEVGRLTVTADYFKEQVIAGNEVKNLYVFEPVSFCGVTFTHKVIFIDIEFKCTVTFDGCRMEKGLTCSNTIFRRGLKMSKTICSSSFLLDHVSILKFDGGASQDGHSLHIVECMFLYDVRWSRSLVDGDLLITKTTFSERSVSWIEMRIHGDLRLTSSTLKSGITMNGLTISCWTRIENCMFSKQVWIVASNFKQPFYITGESLEGGIIASGTFKCLTLDCTIRGEIDLSTANIAENFIVHPGYLRYVTAVKVSDPMLARQFSLAGAVVAISLADLRKAHSHS